MRKMVYCRDCRRRRRIEVQMYAIKVYQPYGGDIRYDDMGDGSVLCGVCSGENLDLSKQEEDVLLAAAFAAHSLFW